MALFHLSVTQTKRSAGQSAIASAAYRAGERLYSEYYGEYSDYTRKGGVICSDILLPSHAPPEYADRQTLWSAVEKAERGKNAQLAYSFDIALQNEFSLEENIALARQFLLENFVSRGMVVDFAVHQPDREDGGIPNPHFHVLCPIRPIEQNGKWGLKQRRVYELDEDREKMCSISSVISVRVRSLTSGARLSIVPPRLQRRWVRFCLSPFSRYFFLFSRRSSLCCSCASCVSTCSFSARSCSRFFGFAIFRDLLF